MRREQQPRPQQTEFTVRFEERGDVEVVFLRFDAARRVDELPAGGGEARRLAEDRALKSDELPLPLRLLSPENR